MWSCQFHFFNFTAFAKWTKNLKVVIIQSSSFIGLASDDVKLVLNNNSVPGYGHIHVHKDWKILCRTQALLRNWSLLRQALLWASVDQREFFLLSSLAECFILTTNLETGRESCFFQAPRSPDAGSVACMRTRVNSVLVLRPVDCGSMFAGKWDHQSERAEGRWNMSRQSKKQTVYSTCWESATGSLHEESASFLLWKALWWSKATRTPLFAPWRTRK